MKDVYKLYSRCTRSDNGKLTYSVTIVRYIPVALVCGICNSHYITADHAN